MQNSNLKSRHLRFYSWSITVYWGGFGDTLSQWYLTISSTHLNMASKGAHAKLGKSPNKSRSNKLPFLHKSFSHSIHAPPSTIHDHTRRRKAPRVLYPTSLVEAISWKPTWPPLTDTDKKFSGKVFFRWAFLHPTIMMEEITNNHLGCIKPGTYWEKLPTSTGAGFLSSTEWWNPL